MNKPFYIFLLFLCFCCETKSQVNLVPNGSFEDTVSCPYDQGQVPFADYWSEYGSADYFNSCASSLDFSTPYNWGGYQMPHSGNAYVALGTYGDYVADVREYVYVKLNSPLILGKKYIVSFYTCSSKSNSISASMYTNNIGCRFTNFFPSTSQIVNYAHINNNTLITDTTNWVNIKGEFISDSAYQYLSIGNFFSDLNTQFGYYFTNMQNFAYYYIDDVFVGEDINAQFIDETSIPNVFTPNNDGVNDIWTINLYGYEKINCIIYNRWGIKIFETTKSIIKWDGRITSGIECTDGIYYYTIETIEKTYKGYIQLIR